MKNVRENTVAVATDAVGLGIPQREPFHYLHE